jgi:hypothetical protein
MSRTKRQKLKGDDATSMVKNKMSLPSPGLPEQPTQRGKDPSFGTSSEIMDIISPLIAPMNALKIKIENLNS